MILIHFNRINLKIAPSRNLDHLGFDFIVIFDDKSFAIFDDKSNGTTKGTCSFLLILALAFNLRRFHCVV